MVPGMLSVWFVNCSKSFLCWFPQVQSLRLSILLRFVSWYIGCLGWPSTWGALTRADSEPLARTCLCLLAGLALTMKSHCGLASCNFMSKLIFDSHYWVKRAWSFMSFSRMPCLRKKARSCSPMTGLILPPQDCRIFSLVSFALNT